jgi:hypothetical protein
MSKKSEEDKPQFRIPTVFDLGEILDSYGPHETPSLIII